jgi:AcrR family transcriptional regulator
MINTGNTKINLVAGRGFGLSVTGAGRFRSGTSTEREPTPNCVCVIYKYSAVKMRLPMAAPRRNRKSPARNAKRKWVRLSPVARREVILTEAIIFFAEHGFEAQTRELASRIGVSQALIYRYFSTKAELINSVYQRIYMSHWNPFWEELLNDRRVPLNKRLKDFYKSYLSTFDDYAWIRVSVYSGLRGNNLVSRYIDMVIERVLHVISLELRYECGLPVLPAPDIPKLDLELAWNFHATIIYFLMRRYVFQKQPCDENDAVAEQMVDQILVGTIAVLRQRYRSSVPLKLLRQR